MKLFLSILVSIFVLCLFSAGIHAETRIIESKATLIINDQEISSPFKVVLSKDGITVNGVEFPHGDRFHVEVDTLPVDKKPSIEDVTYIDWLILTSIKLANDKLAAGNTTEETWNTVEKYLENNTDGEIVKLWGGNGSYHVKHRDLSLPVGFNLPSEYKIHAPLTMEEKLRNRFQSICTYLENDMHIENREGRVTASSVRKE